jgi:hypothetical protein
MTAEGVAYLLAGAVVLLVLFHLALESVAPDTVRARRLRAARRQVSAGRAEVVRAGRGCGDEKLRRSRGAGLLPYLSLAAFAVVLAMSPVAVAGAKGVRGNPVAPRVVGPDRLVQVTLPVADPHSGFAPA